MLIYSYRCSQCGYQFDDLQPMDSVPNRPCQAPVKEGEVPCLGTAVRVPAAVSFRFNCSMPTYQKPAK